MVTKQQQLEWLAKKFCIWPVHDGAPIRMSSVAIGEVNNGLGVAHHIRMDEWQQEREQMLRKPKMDNSWSKRGELPPVGCECEMKHTCWDEFQHVFVLAITREYVIVSDHSTPAIEQHYHLRDITFRPISTERKREIDSSWYESGKLPPVGVPVELWFGGSFAYNCEFISTRKYDYVLWNLDDDKPDCADSMNSQFRPLRTEREKAIEELNTLVGDIEKYPTWRDAIAAIYDAGYRKVKP